MYDLKKDAGQKGFTLIEILIAMAILAIGILGVLKMQISAIKGNATAMRLTEKFSITSNQIEYLMTLPYDHSDLDMTNGTVRLPADQPLAGYTMSWTVEDNTDDPTIPSDTKRVTVTVDPGTYSSDLDFQVEQLITDLD